MAKACNCNDGIFNSGIPSCSEGFGRVKKAIFVSYYDSLGNINSISSSDVLDQTYFDGKVNNADLFLRYFPTDSIFNIVDERGDDIVETIEGIDFEVEQGVRNFTGEFVNKFSASPAYLKFLNSLKCPIVGVYYITEDNKIVGDGSANNESLRPFLVQQGSLKSKYIPKTATTVAKNQISFALDKSMEDQYIQFVEAEDDVNLLNLNGLISITLENLVATSVSDIALDSYISVSNSVRRVAFAGEVIGNWEVYNVTTASSVTPLSITASAPYNFAFVLPPQTSGDTIRVKVALSGYESNEITVVLP